jgi:hypothetical protein
MWQFVIIKHLEISAILMGDTMQDVEEDIILPILPLERLCIPCLTAHRVAQHSKHKEGMEEDPFT